ncbi:hypothetical protein KAR91_31865 [Candidatus Pacearchaeota archaeon]|nr:hypothetical protein [Candidatus Pacearchaeota archaeon]
MSPHNELHRLAEWAACIPFLVLSVHDGKTRVGLDFSRIIETLAVAMIVGGVTLYVTTSVIAERVDSIKESLVEFKQEVKEDLKEIRRDFYKPSIPGG